MCRLFLVSHAKPLVVRTAKRLPWKKPCQLSNVNDLNGGLGLPGRAGDTTFVHFTGSP